MKHRIINNHNHIKYLLLIFVFVLLWISLCFGLIILNQVRKMHIPQDALYLYQLEKIKKLIHSDIIFIGDSSLGNAINAKLWTKLSGQKCINLALTEGVFGYVGGYIMLSNVILKGIKPKNVIMFFNPRQIGARPLYESHIQQSHFFWSEKLPLYKTLYIYWNTYMNDQVLQFNIKKLWLGKVKGESRQIFVNDYMEQKPTKRGEKHDFNDNNPPPLILELDNLLFLKKIHDLCQINRINCIYSHGPLGEKLYDEMKHLMPTINNHIENIPFTIVKNTPIIPPEEDLGDTPMHIHPDIKNQYTRKYYNLIHPYLAN